MPSEKECIESLLAAAERLGRSPTRSEYDDLGIRPVSRTIARVVGSWNEAKEAAGLETYEPGEGGPSPQPKPSWVDLPEGYDWQELNPQQRWYYKNREERVAVKSRRKAKLRRWLFEYKRDVCECSRCGESDPLCLDFHHTGEKRMGIAKMVAFGHARETILDEIEECVVLCANCHRKEHQEPPMVPRPVRNSN